MNQPALLTWKQARIQAGMKQAELGRRVGMSQPLISMLEVGDHTPTEKEDRRLRKALGIMDSIPIYSARGAMELLEQKIRGASTEQERLEAVVLLRSLT